MQGQLLENPRMGTLIKKNTYKIRLGVKSKGRGKSGGVSIITHVIEIEMEVSENENDQDFTVILVSIYDKSEIDNLTEKQLRDLLEEIETNLESEE